MYGLCLIDFSLTCLVLMLHLLSWKSYTFIILMRVLDSQSCYLTKTVSQKLITVVPKFYKNLSDLSIQIASPASTEERMVNKQKDICIKSSVSGKIQQKKVDVKKYRKILKTICICSCILFFHKPYITKFYLDMYCLC